MRSVVWLHTGHKVIAPLTEITSLLVLRCERGARASKDPRPEIQDILSQARVRGNERVLRARAIVDGCY
jgi:hypothetical protein